MGYDRSPNNDPSDDLENRLHNGIGAKLFKRAGKKTASKVLARGGKILAGLLQKAGVAIIGLVGPAAFFIGLIIVLTLILFAGIYWGMSEESILTDATAQARDAEVEEYAANRADKSNVFNTWVVAGEGSWHQQRVAQENREYLLKKFSTEYRPSYASNQEGEIIVGGMGYSGEDMPEWKFLGRLADNEAREQRYLNYWGDVYAPILFDSLRLNQDNLMAQDKFRNDGFNQAAFELKPYFYYKSSTITITSTDDKGESHTSVTNIYLLVEVYSIRGHEQFHYKWITETCGSTTIIKEVPDNTVVLDNGKKYLTEFLEKRLQLEPAEQELMTDTVFQAMQSFTAKQERMQWLADNGMSQNTLISGASIPGEFFNILREASRATGIPVSLLAAIIHKESSWNPRAINESTGCFGLTQLSPEYWESWAQRYGFDPAADRWNPKAQIMIGAMVLRDYIGETKMPDWESRDWYIDSGWRRAMARYGGYGSDVDKASSYIDDIVSKSRAYITRAVFPAVGYGLASITKPYGDTWNSRLGKNSFHGAVDIGCPEGTPIVSASAGLVTQAGWNPDYGNYIIITDLNYDYFYAHLSVINVQVKQEVEPGTIIGLSGNTGAYSQGAHLHFSISMVGGNPMNYTGAVNPINILLLSQKE